MLCENTKELFQRLVPLVSHKFFDQNAVLVNNEFCKIFVRQPVGKNTNTRIIRDVLGAGFNAIATEDVRRSKFNVTGTNPNTFEQGCFEESACIMPYKGSLIYVRVYGAGDIDSHEQVISFYSIDELISSVAREKKLDEDKAIRLRKQVYDMMVPVPDRLFPSKNAVSFWTLSQIERLASLKANLLVTGE